jgi:hypothetical protein
MAMLAFELARTGNVEYKAVVLNGIIVVANVVAT